MRSVSTSITTLTRDPRLRELLAWCAPALLAGLILRVVLTVHLPYAYFHDDSRDFIDTPHRLMHEGKFGLHGKKTFLTPVLLTIPVVLHIPAMIAFPIWQHLLGLGLVVLIGALCRLWLTHWKWFIVPLTLLAAVNPYALWYEHTIMAETQFIFCITLVALAGTLYARAQSSRRFVFLCVALFLLAGARPEGKLLFGFGIALLAFVHLRDLRAAWPRLATLLLLGIATHFMTRTSQAGLLLYTSVARFTPSELRSAPGFETYIAPIRAELHERWEERRSFPRVRDRRLVSAAVKLYLRDHSTGESGRSAAESLCLKLAMETCLRNLHVLPGYVYHKFRYASTDSPAGGFDNYWLFDKQRRALLGAAPKVMRLSPCLFGQRISSEAELHRFIDRNYGSVPWFDAYSDGWLAAMNSLRLPDQAFEGAGPPQWRFVYHGVPLYFLAAAAGVIAMALRPGRLQPFHLAWGLALFGFFFVVMLTANVRPRFRFLFEPFWFIYIALLIETLWIAVSTPFRRS